MKITYVPASVAKEYLEELAKNSELNEVQKETLKHLQKISKLKPEDANKLKEELMGLGLSEFVSVKIVDILPENIDVLRTVVYPHITNLDTELGNRILELISKYR